MFKTSSGNVQMGLGLARSSRRDVSVHELQHPASTMQPVRGLVSWLQTHWPTIRAARDKFDGQSRSRKAS